MNAIEIRNLTKDYGKKRAVTDLSLTVAEGDIFGFIGPNGAGKSTTIRTLLGLIGPTSGEARLLGKRAQEDGGSILAQVGYLPSEISFYGGMRVREALKFSAGLRRIDCGAEAERLCGRLSIDPSARISELSLGNRKKVGIVCALQHKPRLCILDEPTSGLDPLIQREFFALLRERNREGMTVFLSSHVLSEIQRHCNNAAVIRQGRLLACDRVERLGHTETKRITLRGVSDMPRLEGIRSAEMMPDGVSFLYDGSAKELIAALSQLPVRDLTITEPDLEEIFMHYYEGADV